MTEEETKTWNSIVRELYFMKKNKQVKKIHTDTIYPKMDSFALEKSLSYLDFLILSTRSKRQDLSDEALANYLIITMEQLDSCYIRNLHLFESSIPEMIKRLIKRNKNNIERILKESYLKYFLPYLTIEEQIYLQAKLHSYNNSNLTISKIAEYMHISKEILSEYQIMTPYDELNQLNKVFKKGR